MSYDVEELRNRINDLYGALLQERLKQCQYDHVTAEAVKQNGRSTMHEASSSSIVVRSASKRRAPSIGRKS
jgi:hypothetical protein